MIQITNRAGLHCQKICHREILETDSLREVKSIKQVSVNKFDPGVGGDRRKLVRLICYAEILVIAGILVFGAFAGLRIYIIITEKYKVIASVTAFS